MMFSPRILIAAFAAVIGLVGCASAPQSVNEDAAKWTARAEARTKERWTAIFEKRFEAAFATYSSASKLNYSPEAIGMYALQLGPSDFKIRKVECGGDGCDLQLDLTINVKAPRGPVITHSIPVDERWVLEKGDLFFVRKL